MSAKPKSKHVLTGAELNASFQRRGKIAKLPRAIREQLNVRLDNGQEAPEILPWLNALPAARRVLLARFQGAAVSPQNLTAWRQGGFQDWLLHRELLDKTAQMSEDAEELQNCLADDQHPGWRRRSLPDDLMTQTTARWAVLLSGWNGQPDAAFESRLGLLLQISQFLLKLQQARRRAEREDLQLEQLRREAALVEEREREDEELEAYYQREEEKIAESTRRSEKMLAQLKEAKRREKETNEGQPVPPGPCEGGPVRRSLDEGGASPTNGDPAVQAQSAESKVESAEVPETAQANQPGKGQPVRRSLDEGGSTLIKVEAGEAANFDSNPGNGSQVSEAQQLNAPASLQSSDAGESSLSRADMPLARQFQTPPGQPCR